MNKILTTLEWLAKYGFIDIFFGIGVIGVISSLAKLIRKSFPINHEDLHIDISQGGPVSIPPDIITQQSFNIQLSNSGKFNIYIARAYFLAKQRVWWTLWFWNKPTELAVHPGSHRITKKGNAFELKFSYAKQNIFEEHETLLRWKSDTNKQSTWLALSQPVAQQLINNRTCGTLYIEYATLDKRGVHKVKV